MQIHFSGRKLTFPRMCVCCGASPDTEMSASHTRTTGKRVIKEQTRSWEFPYCSICVAHVKAWDSVDLATGLSLVGGILVAIGVGVSASVGAAAIVTLVTLVVAMILFQRHRSRVEAEMCTQHCSCPQSAVSFLGWDGSVQSFEIRSQGYLVEFARANARKLINASMALLSAIDDVEKHVSVQVSTRDKRNEVAQDSPGPRKQPQGDSDILLKWIGKIESLKGPVSRRNALERGLKELTTSEAKQTLVLEASKIEARAVLDKVDALKTTRAKRRHLEEAIEALESDSIPDELQAREIALLRQALSELTE